MGATPVWFGSESRPLLGWFNAPTGQRARAAVVICPGVGRDGLQPHYALRLLAEELAGRGFAVLRFDYDGTGDSAGSDSDPDRVEAWLGSIRSALQFVRGCGLDSVVLVGMRLGATLAGTVAAEGGIEGLVLWDPAPSGRAFLAEQAALTAGHFRGLRRRDDGSVEGPGVTFSPGTVRDLRRVDLAKTEGRLAEHVLVLLRSDRSPGRLVERLSMPHVEWQEAAGQAELMDVGAEDQKLPLAAIDSIANWVSGISPRDDRPIAFPAPAGPAVVGTAPDGTAVVETPTFVGPCGLFGILTEPAGGARGPAVIMMSAANEPRSGPCRMWTDLARLWAGAGLRSLRFDMSSVGESPLRSPDQAAFEPRSPAAFDDVLDAARHASPEDPSDVVLVGLCSSAYQALDSAFEVVPLGVVALQPVLSFVPPETAAGLPVDPRRRVAMPLTPVLQAFSDGGALAALRRRFPDLGWRLRMLVKRSQRPGRWLRRLDRLGVDVLMVCGEWEGRAVRLGTSRREKAHLRRSGRFRFEYQPDQAHGLVIEEQRLPTMDLVASHVLERFLTPAGEGTKGAAGQEPASAGEVSGALTRPLLCDGGA